MQKILIKKRWKHNLKWFFVVKILKAIWWTHVLLSGALDCTGKKTLITFCGIGIRWNRIQHLQFLFFLNFDFHFPIVFRISRQIDQRIYIHVLSSEENGYYKDYMSGENYSFRILIISTENITITYYKVYFLYFGVSLMC